MSVGSNGGQFGVDMGESVVGKTSEEFPKRNPSYELIGGMFATADPSIGGNREPPVAPETTSGVKVSRPRFSFVLFCGCTDVAITSDIFFYLVFTQANDPDAPGFSTFVSSVVSSSQAPGCSPVHLFLAVAVSIVQRYPLTCGFSCR